MRPFHSGPQRPENQTILWDPSVLSQMALMSRLWLLLTHSRVYKGSLTAPVRKSSFLNYYFYIGTRVTRKQIKWKEKALFGTFGSRFDTKSNLKYLNSNQTKNRNVITTAVSSVSRVSRLTGAIMRSLGIITERIDVTVMGVGRTLVNIYERKLQREKR